MEETLRRTRTSPRTNVINEVQDIIDTHLRAWSQASPDIRAHAEVALEKVRDEVEKLRAGHPKSDKSEDDTTAVAPRTKGTHFVGVTGDEKVMYLHRDGEGTYHTDDGNSETLAHIYGSFRTEAGARYVVAHPDTLSQYQRIL